MQRRPVEIIVLSDVHLGTYGCHANEVLAYLRSVDPGLLILKGDIIDGWQFRKSFFPASHIAVLKEILAFLSRGTRVVYITGNHDEFLRRYSGMNLENLTLCDKYTLDINGKRTWIFHGDVFDNTTKGSAKILAKLGGYGYDLLILLNRFVNFLAHSVGRDKVSFSKKIKNSVKKAVTYINRFESTVAELAAENNFDVVICGHIHQPEERVFTVNGRKVTYLNSGDWIENLSALEYAQGAWSIHYHSADVKENVARMMPVLNVVSDDIDCSLHYLQDENILCGTGNG